MTDDRVMREMTCDPKFRKVLVTDGRSAVGQEMVRALAAAGADLVWAGCAEPLEGARLRSARCRRSPSCRSM